MEYSNPEIPEGINTSREHPLKEFFILLASIVAIICITVITVSLLAEKLAAYIPFSIEEQLVSDFEPSVNDNKPQFNAYIETLAADLEKIIGLPDDMNIRIYYINNDIENAYATLGGHVYIYCGLVKLLPNENALAMVIAHEIAHIKHRHPVIAMGRGVVIGLLLASITGISGDYFVGKIVNDVGLITLFTFNRDQEQDADITAITAVEKYYGHIAGADELFQTLLQLEDKYPDKPPAFLRTHPLGQKRIDNMHELAKQNYWRMMGQTTPLPENIVQCQVQSDN